MTIEAELFNGPEGYGLPKKFSITGASQTSEQGAEILVQGNHFVGFAEGEGGRIEMPYFNLAPIEIAPDQTAYVEIIFNNKDPKVRRVQTATYIVIGT